MELNSRLLPSEERHGDSHVEIQRVGRVLLERAPGPGGSIRGRWVYDHEADARHALERRLREAI